MIIQRTDGAVYAEDDSDHVVTTVVYEDSARLFRSILHSGMESL